MPVIESQIDAIRRIPAYRAYMLDAIQTFRAPRTRSALRESLRRFRSAASDAALVGRAAARSLRAVLESVAGRHRMHETRLVPAQLRRHCRHRYFDGIAA